MGLQLTKYWLWHYIIYMGLQLAKYRLEHHIGLQLTKYHLYHYIIYVGLQLKYRLYHYIIYTWLQLTKVPSISLRHIQGTTTHQILSVSLHHIHGTTTHQVPTVALHWTSTHQVPSVSLHHIQGTTAHQVSTIALYLCRLIYSILKFSLQVHSVVSVTLTVALWGITTFYLVYWLKHYNGLPQLSTPTVAYIAGGYTTATSLSTRTM